MGNEASTATTTTTTTTPEIPTNPDDTHQWAPSTGYGAVLDNDPYDQHLIQTLITRLGLQPQVEQLSELHLPPGAPTRQQAAENRDIALDFWTVTSAGVLEDGNTSTLGAVKPQSIARLVESLQSFVVASDEQAQISRTIAQRLIVTHKLNDAVRVERELASRNQESSQFQQAVEGKEVDYEPSTELGMFFLSSLLACTKSGSNIEQGQLKVLLDAIQELFDPSDPSFFREWSPPPALPPHLPVNTIASTTRSETGTARGTERASPVYQDVGTAWVSCASDRSDNAVTWGVCFDVTTPVPISTVCVKCLNTLHPTLNKYDEIESKNIDQPLEMHLCLGTSNNNIIKLDVSPTVNRTHAGMSIGFVEYVFQLDGRSASQMRLELIMQDNKQVALSSVQVSSCSNASELPVPRDRRKTIEDLNTWIHSIVHAVRKTVPNDNEGEGEGEGEGQDPTKWAKKRTARSSPGSTSGSIDNGPALHVVDALRCQAAVAIRSGALGSLLCLCECLLEADEIENDSKQRSYAGNDVPPPFEMSTFMDVKAPFCYWLIERLSIASISQMNSHRTRLEEILQHHTQEESKGRSSMLTVFDESCISFGLNNLRKKD